MYQVKVLTVSDSCSTGDRVDESGPGLVAFFKQNGFEIIYHGVVADGVVSVSEALQDLSSGFRGVIVTTGGTGFGPRDLTPEATLQVIEREAPGLAESMRNAAPKGLGRLSRGVCGVTGQCLIINTPGSVKGSIESIETIIDVVPHILDLLAGETPH